MSNSPHPLQTVFARILEEWALMIVEPAVSSSEAFDPNQRFFVISAEYRGVFNGELTIICQPPFIEALARNVLGLDSEETLTTDEYWDALKEFANVVSGNYLVEMYGEETVFDLPAFKKAEESYEEITKYFEQKSMKYLTEATALYLADDQPVYASFDISANEY